MQSRQARMARSDPSDHVLLPPCCSQHSRCSMVVTQQTAQPVATLDLTGRLTNRCFGPNQRIVQPLVISFPVIVEHELFPRTTKMILFLKILDDVLCRFSQPANATTRICHACDSMRDILPSQNAAGQAQSTASNCLVSPFQANTCHAAEFWDHTPIGLTKRPTAPRSGRAFLFALCRRTISWS
jgi:hypothetical protein